MSKINKNFLKKRPRILLKKYQKALENKDFTIIMKSDSNIGMVYTDVYVYHQYLKMSYLEYNGKMPEGDIYNSICSVPRCFATALA